MAFDEEFDINTDDQQESENDLKLSKSSISDAVLFNTDWTVETIFRQIAKGNINLDPKFQRREAWNDERKSKLIESILCNYPIPNVVLAEDKNHKGKYIVIDGKQRLTSISSFLSNEISLEKLSVRSDLNSKKFSDLESNGTDDISTLENYPIRTIIIRNWPNEDYLYSVFYRLNSGSLPLSPQELRKALHGGRLLETIDDYISQSHPFKSIFGAKPDPRMRDVEIVLRYVAFDLFYEQYDGNLKRFLDSTVTHFDTDWSQKQISAVQSLKKLDNALTLTHKVFGENSFKKWNGEKYERRPNRAVIDIMTRFFSDITQISPQDSQTIEACFKTTCNQDERFRNSIERTTKTPTAVRTRHLIWGEKLSKILGKNLDQENMRLV
ncbi:TPA: DUF262 domain-containing protein [Pseudomonas aeruginosa]|uniref:DUF262 domain-containing protein n=1 Tax=Pseudomonas aeruginosa TaxID=287 RepID=UPI00033C0699|nr:DUF262 domain-containing protein [Pseudomonas aeruginosa]ARI04389.1 hypothetical protein Y880_04609 [Pseudomonas aeruginosa PAK]EOT09643.1 hypothetical protein PAK_05161 [Pseudomonas aeruginosa PAK]RMK86319.1 hypothetical protein IPC83_29130 [Pseudomonas aeruginosa]VUY47042.1 Uncharacterized conserved protein,Protein of unknown function DUF262 [Pseudomonas aeruginosa PAK]HCR1248451.1 DUF262 domain-containing protein [Pseudomonas aeruginosa]